MTDGETPPERATILVVDDTPQNLSLMSGLLEGLYTVKLAPSGARAMKIVASAPPDLILLDVMMPEMDGYEVCRILKDNPATCDIPVIFLTAMDKMEDEERGLQAGAVDYITKPISPPILLARVRNQLLLRDAMARLREQNALLSQEKEKALGLLEKIKFASDKLLEQNRRLKQEELRSRELFAMLGQTYRSQDKLVAVWEKLRQFPLTASMMDEFYKLGLEFERRAQPDMAEVVFRHMAAFDPGYRDLATRLASVPDGVAGTSPGETIGRYRVVRQLGTGAMGVVYLGSDPKIGREVAIKTMALSKELPPDELQDIKERFFREAESAGRLTHPGIVAIYDVGEERNFAYIAMELLTGRDLSAYTQPDRLLPIERVLSIVERVALALDYAHARGVVHRDVKPANIVYEAETDSLKVTDFGIASIASGAAKDAGIILGTPAYMSPEQVNGHAIDGRADIFSLGVSLYLLATGQLPFHGESLAQLMFNIANAPHVDIRSHNPDLPDCLSTIVDKALAKDPGERYPVAADIAEALNLCRRSMMVFAA